MQSWFRIIRYQTQEIFSGVVSALIDIETMVDCISFKVDAKQTQLQNKHINLIVNQNWSFVERVFCLRKYSSR